MLSIIIPTKDRAEILQQTLQKAINATEGFNVEIIVINDGNEFTQKIENQKIQYHNNPKKGVSAARNFGASLAISDLLLFLDDDMWITKETIVNIEKIKQELNLKENVCCLNWEYPEQLNQKLATKKIGRYILNATYNTMKGRISKQLIWKNTFEEIQGIGSCSFLISKATFNKIGGYNESIIFQGEDIDMANKIIQENIKILAFTPITCFHNHQDRIDINGYIDREYRGYASQAKAEQQGLIQKTNQNDLKTKFYQLLLPFESIFIFIFNLLPNKKMFDSIAFKLIGILGALQKVKAYSEK